MRTALLLFLAFTLLLHATYSQYWFQSGVIANSSQYQNTGISVQIQTLAQHITNGSMAFWVGETLENGAFIQVGYAVQSQTGYYPNDCTVNACSSQVYMNANTPYAFFEYFYNTSAENSFYGTFSNASLGNNNTFNNYSAVYDGGVWDFYINGKKFGSADVGSGTSGPQPPYSVGEYANATNNSTFMSPVKMKNFSVVVGGRMVHVPAAYSYVGYGVNSSHSEINDYGVAEVRNVSDYFIVGSGINRPVNGTYLWDSGYELNLSSAFGNSSVTEYTFGSRVGISEPSVVNISNGARAVFEGWDGSGIGSYTGNASSANISMYGDVNERAVWQIQYFLNLSTDFGAASGSGWYDKGSIAHISVNNATIYMSKGSRYVFEGWAGSGSDLNGNYVLVNESLVLSALWKKEYLLSLTSRYGQVYGGGWYANGTVARFGINFTNITNSRNSITGFYRWSNGYAYMQGDLIMNRSYNITAEFRPATYVTLKFLNENGKTVNASDITALIDNRSYTDAKYLFLGNNTLEGVDFLGYWIPENISFNVSSSGEVNITLPLYQVSVKTSNFYGYPVNSTVELNFVNETSFRSYTGKNGTLAINNVIYGEAKGIAIYRNESIGFATAYGTGGRVVFQYGESWVLFFIVACAVALVAYLTLKHARW